MSVDGFVVEGRACGMGEGETCCAFLVVDGRGTVCGREIPGLAETVRARIEAGSFTARRLPSSEYPTCQEEGR